jgi:hypothetical protein
MTCVTFAYEMEDGIKTLYTLCKLLDFISEILQEKHLERMKTTSLDTTNQFVLYGRIDLCSTSESFEVV